MCDPVLIALYSHVFCKIYSLSYCSRIQCHAFDVLLTAVMDVCIRSGQTHVKCGQHRPLFIRALSVCVESIPLLNFVHTFQATRDFIPIFYFLKNRYLLTFLLLLLFSTVITSAFSWPGSWFLSTSSPLPLSSGTPVRGKVIKQPQTSWPWLTNQQSSADDASSASMSRDISSRGKASSNLY